MATPLTIRKRRLICPQSCPPLSETCPQRVRPCPADTLRANPFRSDLCARDRSIKVQRDGMLNSRLEPGLNSTLNPGLKPGLKPGLPIHPCFTFQRAALPQSRLDRPRGEQHRMIPQNLTKHNFIFGNTQEQNCENAEQERPKSAVWVTFSIRVVPISHKLPMDVAATPCND